MAHSHCTGPGPENDGFLYYAMCCTHYTGTGTVTGTGKWSVSVLCYVLYTLHRDRDRDLDRDREMMGFYIMLCAVHTAQGQAQGPWQGPGNDGFLYYAMCCTHYIGEGTSPVNHCFLLYPSRSRVQVPCSVYNPLHIFLTDFLSITNFILVTTKSFIKTRNTTHGSHFSGLTKFPDFTSIFPNIFLVNNNWSFFFLKKTLLADKA